MNQHAGEDPRNSHRYTEPITDTPIYDRLLAEWRAASAASGPAPDDKPAPTRPRRMVPAARAAADAAGS